MPPSAKSPSAEQALSHFVQYARQMLDAATTEPRRRELEAQLLALLPVVHALGLFDLFEVRDSALAALLRDELAERRELRVAA